MNQLQKKITDYLLKGDYLVKRKNHKDEIGFMLYTGNANPVMFVKEDLLKPVKDLLRRNRNSHFVIDKRLVRQMHGKCYIKTRYKSLLNNNNQNNGNITN